MTVEHGIFAPLDFSVSNELGKRIYMFNKHIAEKNS